ncbi:MAG TPA: UDP-3-O-acyl-N-acetylglucosamine deacetylase [Candidatus Dojkabacteria bacterium]|nr:UDP-3-O-acyl-N-acetylglucosamine deacetylase [Candidatus Dojkabacteria bacterium]
MKLSLKESNKSQRTIAKEITFEGQSLFSSTKISMQLLPAEVNTGIVFNVNGTKIPALSDYLNFTELHTTSLTKDDAEVLMVEHLLAAIWGMGIDNIEIKLDQKIIPAQDGSAEPFAQALKEAGITVQGAKRTVVEIHENLYFEQPEFEGRKATLSSNSNGLSIELTAPYPAPINTYTVNYSENDDFEKKVSWARTFLRSPLDPTDLTKWNGIRSVYKALPEDPRQSPVITFTESKFLTPLKAENEPAMHKMLDTIGDLALVGYRINGHFKIDVPGHKFTHLIAKEIRSQLNGQEV